MQREPLLLVLRGLFSLTVDGPNDQLLRLNLVVQGNLLKKPRVRMLRERGGRGRRG